MTSGTSLSTGTLYLYLCVCVCVCVAMRNIFGNYLTVFELLKVVRGNLRSAVTSLHKYKPLPPLALRNVTSFMQQTESNQYMLPSLQP